MSYDWKITAKKFGEAAGPGVLLGAIGGALVALNVALGMLENLNGEITVSRVAMIVAVALASALVGALTGALKALQNYVKNRVTGARGPFDNAIMVLFVAGACLCFPGCMSLAPYGPGALSSNNVKVVESTAHAEGVDTFALEIKSRGDAAAKTSVKYTGEAEADETPWAFAVLGEANVESAERVKPLNEGAGAALAALPVTLAPLVDALSLVNDAPEGTPGASIRDRLMGLIMDRVLGAITGGGTP